MEWKLPIPIVDTIKKRHSVRTFTSQKLSAEDKKKLTDFFKELQNPFGVDVHIHILDKELDSNGEKLGTYGVIKGASTFLGVSVPHVEDAFFAAGYEFENLILYAASMGLGTVWLAATFSRSHFASAMKIGSDEWFPAISPVGYTAAKQSIRESLMRAAMKSSSRKPWSHLFFRDDFGTALTEHDAGDYAECLEMLRLAPSATNAQPWRVLKRGNVYHFYETHSANLSENEAKIKQVDLGIALSHFHQTALERGLSGKFEKLTQDDVKVPNNTWYFISWIADIPSNPSENSDTKNTIL